MQKSNTHNEKSGMLLPVAKALGTAVVAGTVLPAIFCFAALRFDDPEKAFIRETLCGICQQRSTCFACQRRAWYSGITGRNRKRCN